MRMTKKQMKTWAGFPDESKEPTNEQSCPVCGRASGDGYPNCTDCGGEGGKAEPTNEQNKFLAGVMGVEALEEKLKDE